jgi:hypothetical protein
MQSLKRLAVLGVFLTGAIASAQNTFPASGNVGIGTASPQAPLDVSGVGGVMITGGTNLDPAFGYSFTPLKGTGKMLVGWNRSGGDAEIDFVSSNVGTYIGGFNFYELSSGGSLSPLLSVQGNGNVGIGTMFPGYSLDVSGKIHTNNSVVYPDGSSQTTAWTGVLCGGDYAEAMNALGGKKLYEPGDVLVLTSGTENDVQKSSEPYSTMVAGIYATKPGVIGRRQSLTKDSNELPMAMVGVVPTKVTAENGPIHKGDLLVSSSTPGYAMKGTDRSRLVGAVLGKAMGSLDSGTGVIEVLVTLQ